MGGERYWFGYTYQAAMALDDMTLSPGTAGLQADRFEVAWTWNSPGPCVLYITTTEDFDLTGLGPAYQNPYDGLIVCWDHLDQGCWYTDVDLTGSGLGLQMPMDSFGGVLLVLATGWMETKPILAPLASPQLWGTKDPTADPPGTNPSRTSNIMWLDDGGNGVSDGIFDPNTDCHDMSGSQCPSPLGLCLCMYVPAAEDDDHWCDPNCDGAIDGSDIEPFFLGLAYPEIWKETYPCPYLVGMDMNQDGVVDGADINAFYEALAVGHCPP